MDENYEILVAISNNPHTSNRKLARSIHKAVGTVNARLHELMASKMIIVIKDDANGFTYELTPEGKAYLAQLLYQEVTRALGTVDLVRQRIRLVLKRLLDQGKHHFYLYGQEDGVCRMIKMALIELSLEQAVTYSVLEVLANNVDFKTTECLLIWENHLQNCHPSAMHILI